MKPLAFLFLSLALLCSSCGGSKQASGQEAGPAGASAQPVHKTYTFSGKTPEELKKFRVVLETSLGKMELSFYPDIAPEHVRSFLRLCQAGFYDHTAWHRIVRGFIIQGGDLATRNPPLQTAEMSGGVRRLKPEFSKLKHKEGTLAMAHGEALDSAETSFYICLAPQPKLDNKYTIFGEVASGMDTVKKIANVPLGENRRPRERVELVSAEVIEAGN